MQGFRPAGSAGVQGRWHVVWAGSRGAPSFSAGYWRGQASEEHSCLVNSAVMHLGA